MSDSQAHRGGLQKTHRLASGQLLTEEPAQEPLAGEGPQIILSPERTTSVSDLPSNLSCPCVHLSITCLLITV